VVLDLTFDLKSRGNTESNVKSTTLAEHDVKIFRCGESAPANSIIGRNDQAFINGTQASARRETAQSSPYRGRVNFRVGSGTNIPSTRTDVRFTPDRSG